MIIYSLKSYSHLSSKITQTWIPQIPEEEGLTSSPSSLLNCQKTESRKNDPSYQDKNRPVRIKKVPSKPCGSALRLPTLRRPILSSGSWWHWLIVSKQDEGGFYSRTTGFAIIMQEQTVALCPVLIIISYHNLLSRLEYSILWYSILEHWLRG